MQVSQTPSDAHLQLALYTEGGEDIVPLADYLARHAAGQPLWTPSFDDCALIINVKGRDWLGDAWNLGHIGVIVLELEDARRRLALGQTALIRSAVEDQSEVPFLVLEPRAQTDVLISLFFVDDVDIQRTYPILREPTRIRALFDYVATHRSSLVGAAATQLSDHAFTEVPFPFDPLLASLQREAQLGRQLYALFGRSMPGPGEPHPGRQAPPHPGHA